jgi:hypothetical protein
MSDIEAIDVRCENCVFANIYEDVTEDMRRPTCWCSKDHEIIDRPPRHLTVMEWIPKHQCLDYQAGEAKYL